VRRATVVANWKPTIELTNVDELVPTLEQIHKAVADGEIDTILMSAKKERANGFKRNIAKNTLRPSRRNRSFVGFVPPLCYRLVNPPQAHPHIIASLSLNRRK
jgi:hypothetical protein